MIGWGFPPNIEGGLDTHCYELSKAIVKKGHEVHLALPSFNNPDKNVDKIKIRAIRTPKYRSSLRTILRYNKNIFKELVNETFDIIHTHDWFGTLAAFKIREVNKTPWVLTLHSFEYMRACGSGNKEIEQIENFGIKYCDRIIAVSNLVKKEIENRYGLGKKIDVIYNAAGPKLKAYPEAIRRKYNLKNEFIILSVSRLTHQKGIEYLLYAAKDVLKKFPDTKFIIVGKGYLLGSLKKFVRNIGISKSVIFTGFVPESEIPSYYKAADIFVMPSVYEPFGISALEAMSYGCPVIATENAGVCEKLKNGKDIVEVKPKDSKSICKAIIMLLKKKKLRKGIGENGMKSSKKAYSWKIAAKQTLDVYSQLTKNV
jgi:glycosyltransferase involved in cell wall biosynthesis